MSAAGHFFPPLLVFPRVNMKLELIYGFPNGSLAMCHKSVDSERELCAVDPALS